MLFIVKMDDPERYKRDISPEHHIKAFGGKRKRFPRKEWYSKALIENEQEHKEWLSVGKNHTESEDSLIRENGVFIEWTIDFPDPQALWDYMRVMIEDGNDLHFYEWFPILNVDVPVMYINQIIE